MPVIQMLMGGVAGPVVNLINHTFTSTRDANPAPPPANEIGSLTVKFNTSGSLTATTISTSGVTKSPAIGATEWLVSGDAADCEIYATLTSGAVNTGTFGSWLSLSSDRTWTKNLSAFGVGSTSIIDFQIRDKNTLDVLDTCTLTLTIN